MVVNIIITAVASNIPGMQLFEMKFKETASHTGLASGYSKKKIIHPMSSVYPQLGCSSSSESRVFLNFLNRLIKQEGCAALRKYLKTKVVSDFS